MEQGSSFYIKAQKIQHGVQQWLTHASVKKNYHIPMMHHGNVII
jgi:hypothetical protein